MQGAVSFPRALPSFPAINADGPRPASMHHLEEMLGRLGLHVFLLGQPSTSHLHRLGLIRFHVFFSSALEMSSISVPSSSLSNCQAASSPFSCFCYQLLGEFFQGFQPSPEFRCQSRCLHMGQTQPSVHPSRQQCRRSLSHEKKRPTISPHPNLCRSGSWQSPTCTGRSAVVALLQECGRSGGMATEAQIQWATNAPAWHSQCRTHCPRP